jgi:hypothetical protein
MVTVVAIEAGTEQSPQAFFVAASALFTETVACHPLHTPLQSQVHIALVTVKNHHHYFHRGVYSSIICLRVCLDLGASGTRQHTATTACRADYSLPQSFLPNLSLLLYSDVCVVLQATTRYLCSSVQWDRSRAMQHSDCRRTTNLFVNLMTTFISLLWQRKIVVKKSSINRTASGDVCLDGITRNQHRSIQRKILRNIPQTSSR